jgi:1,5-rhamnosyltransferase
LVETGQTGVTLRIVESIVNGIKLITNNSRIEGYDFYSPDNIFILGKDNLEDLPVFLDKPYKPLPSSLIEEYFVDFGVYQILNKSI